MSPGTVSKFANRVYRGDNSVVAERLAEVLASQDAADAIASGDWKANWIVKRGKGVKIVRTKATLEKMRAQDPNLHVVMVWIGPGETDLEFVKV